VEAIEPLFQQEFFGIEIRVCPAALLEHVRLTHTPLIFSEVFSHEEKFLLSFLRGLAVDTGEASHVGWLGYFSLSQTDRIENFFETVGEPVPWDPYYSIHCGMSCCSALKTAGFDVTPSSDQHIHCTHHWDFTLFFHNPFPTRSRGSPTLKY